MRNRAQSKRLRASTSPADCSTRRSAECSVSRDPRRCFSRASSCFWARKWLSAISFLFCCSAVLICSARLHERDCQSKGWNRDERSYWRIFVCMLSTCASSFSTAVFSSSTPVSTAVISGGSVELGSRNLITWEHVSVL